VHLAPFLPRHLRTSFKEKPAVFRRGQDRCLLGGADSLDYTERSRPTGISQPFPTQLELKVRRVAPRQGIQKRHQSVRLEVRRTGLFVTRVGVFTITSGKPEIGGYGTHALTYFKDPLIAVNSAFIFASIPATATRMPRAMPVAIRQYSIAVAAFWSATNLRTAARVGRIMKKRRYHAFSSRGGQDSRDAILHSHSPLI
jgi:hypothetical protein